MVQQQAYTSHLDVLEPLLLVRQVRLRRGTRVLWDLLVAVVVQGDAGHVALRGVVRRALCMAGRHVREVVAHVRVDGLVDEVL